jgi:hypothetical protein
VSESLWQMPQACNRMRTDPAPGSGICRSTISNGPLGRETCTTRIVAMIPPASFEQGIETTFQVVSILIG